jgi:hypothetical protein
MPCSISRGGTAGIHHDAHLPRYHALCAAAAGGLTDPGAIPGADHLAAGACFSVADLMRPIQLMHFPGENHEARTLCPTIRHGLFFRHLPDGCRLSRCRDGGHPAAGIPGGGWCFPRTSPAAASRLTIPDFPGRPVPSPASRSGCFPSPIPSSCRPDPVPA